MRLRTGYAGEKTYDKFGYSFDVAMGTNWPYSQEFWNNANTAAENIKNVITGGCRTPEILIMVNDKRIYYNDNCPDTELLYRESWR